MPQRCSCQCNFMCFVSAFRINHFNLFDSCVLCVLYDFEFMRFVSAFRINTFFFDLLFVWFTSKIWNIN